MKIMHGKVIMSQTDYHLEEDGPVIERAYAIAGAARMIGATSVPRSSMERFIATVFLSAIYLAAAVSYWL
jgi:hypothetical protein